MSIIVPAAGPVPCSVLLVGEAPGQQEADHDPPTPFVGPSGRELEWYLSRRHLSVKQFRRTNVVQEYMPGNPDPSPEQIAFWTPHLIGEIQRTQPALIVAVGRFAARWFLGDTAELEDCHGMPHRGGEFDPGNVHLTARAHGAVVIPTYHPAFGLYNPDAKSVIDWDYSQVAHYLFLVKSNRTHTITYRTDTYAGTEAYIDMSGSDFADAMATDHPDEIGLDTEGRPHGGEWSIQVSTCPGTAYVLRASQPDLSHGIRRLQEVVDGGCLVCTHDAGTPEGCLYDTQVSRGLGLELTDARQWNTMYAAYLLRLESKSLKSLAWRWLGMAMENYQALVGNVARQRQVDYLRHVLSHTWPKPETRHVPKNDGTVKPYTPQAVDKFVQGILRDVEADKLNKDGEPASPYNRWAGHGPNKGVDPVSRRLVESVCGVMPTETLDDIPLDRAVYYAGRDADATLRLRPVLHDQLRHMGLLGLMSTGMSVLPIFEEMQHVGMPASRSKFQALSEYVQTRMVELQSSLSRVYFGGRPFNPGSSVQVATLMRRRGLEGAKRTSTGAVSTAKKSIEHLRYTDPAIALVFDWREHAKVKSTYVDPLLDIASSQPVHPVHPDMFTVYGKIKPVTVTTRRLAMEDPSLLNQPIRTELGRRVRDCYQTYGDEVFGAWDFSGQEMRVAAHVSQDRLLCQLFRQGRDPHGEAATRIFNVTAEQVGKDRFKFDFRLPAKTANFGILYGLSGSGLLDLFRSQGVTRECECGGVDNLDSDDPCDKCGGLGKRMWTQTECDNLIRLILRDVYPDMSKCIRRIQDETVKTGEVRDLYGMIRYLPAAWSQDRKESAEASRQAFSHVVQGTAQGMTQNAMAWLRPYVRDMQREGLNVRWCLQIHDEVILRMDRDLYDVVSPIVVEGMTEHCGIELLVPVEVDGHMAQTWSELK